MTETTQLEVYRAVREHGPVTHDDLAREIWPENFRSDGAERHDSRATDLLDDAVEKLAEGNYVHVRNGEEIIARELENLPSPSEPNASDSPPSDVMTPESALDGR